MPQWQPAASCQMLPQRAKVIQKIRQFFYQRNILEVDTPLLSPATIPDPSIASIKCQSSLYLQTSPEFCMKRLLAAGSGAIFQICKAFREGESGRLHNPEFTMLEWYQPGYDHHQLMKEVSLLIQTVMPVDVVNEYSYQQLFEKHLEINPHTATIDNLIQLAKAHDIEVTGIDNNDKDSWLNILLTHHIEPKLQGLTFIYDYPASQAALAKLRDCGDYQVAERFEAYIGSIELANGFHELCDADEQLQRFEDELQQRVSLGLPEVNIDHELIAALRYGMPACSGVAVGIDRLLMCVFGKDKLSDVMSFVVE